MKNKPLGTLCLFPQSNDKENCQVMELFKYYKEIKTYTTVLL